MWHLLTLGAMATCGWLAAWQWQRAGSAMGSALNVGYGLQWPVFAIFFGVMWWRMLRMEAAKIRETEGVEEVAEPVAAPSVSESGAGVRTAPPRAARGLDAPSPFGPRPHSAPPVTDEDDPELADYNRMLAQLAARHPED